MLIAKHAKMIYKPINIEIVYNRLLLNVVFFKKNSSKKNIWCLYNKGF